MKKLRCVLRVNSKKLYERIEMAIENFKDMEAQYDGNVDLEQCSQDYINAVLIFNQTLFNTEVIYL